jgi:hypothetical protein
LPLSVTVAVKFAVPVVVGVPLIVPLALRFRPAGSAPLLTVHAYPPVPPLAASVWEYPIPAVASGSDAVVIASGAVFAVLTAMLSCFDAVAPLVSVTVTVKFEVAAVVGVPAIVPDELRFRPAGSAPPVRLQLYGALPPLA